MKKETPFQKIRDYLTDRRMNNPKKEGPDKPKLPPEYGYLRLPKRWKNE